VGKHTNGGKRLQGRPPKHGARLLERVLWQNKLDKRTGVAKLLASIENDLAADRGGWPSTSAAEKILIGRAAFLALVCSSIENWLLRQPELVVKGELLGPLKKGLTTHQANLTRALSALGIKSSAPKLPTLEEYLSTRRNGSGADTPPLAVAQSPASPAASPPSANEEPTP
jgi:hypothetical protein